MKWSKQQIESKDLHLGLLKKKVAELEELLREKGRVEVERDENSLRYKKLVKHNDKLQRELLDYKQQITNLKAKLLEASELRVSHCNLGIILLNDLDREKELHFWDKFQIKFVYYT